MRKDKKPARHTKIIDDTVKISDKKGNGILKFLMSIDDEGMISKYSFAYINPHLCVVDNCRVLGYDNSHGYHHKHFMGKEEKINFISYADIENRFDKEWRELHEKFNKQKKK